LAQRLREAQEGYERTVKASAKKDQADFYRVVVFRDAESADKLSEAMQVPGQVFLPGDQLMRLLGDGEDGEA
jgi:hypothetical protein